MSVVNILSKLKEINNANLVSVYVPSAKKQLSFRPLSVKQQKDLIKSGLDGVISGITISNVINEIILENSVDKHDFVITDKFPVILSLRKQSFGNIFVIKEEDKETVFDLDEVLKKKLKFTYDDKVIIKMEGTDIMAYLDLVSLSDDTKINIAQIEKFKKTKDEQLSETVGSLFIYEIVKFVTKIQIKEEELDLTTLPIKDRINVIESIPATLNNKILEYIQKFRTEETDYVTTSSGVLPIDSRLFTKE
jgi:hypothetical protein